MEKQPEFLVHLKQLHIRKRILALLVKMEWKRRLLLKTLGGADPLINDSKKEGSLTYNIQSLVYNQSY
jgi:hypothetical protein